MHSNDLIREGFVPHRLVYFLGSYMELISYPRDDARSGDILVNIRNPGDPTSVTANVSAHAMQLQTATCSACHRHFYPVVRGESKEARVKCPGCDYEYYFAEQLSDPYDETCKLMFQRPSLTLGPELTNLQRIMEAYRWGWLQHVELRMSCDGGGSLLRDDSAGRKGDICYVELQKWADWEGFARMLTDESTQHIIQVHANPGRLPSGWIYACDGERATFDSYGQPELIKEDKTWYRVGPANRDEIDWYGR
jgi:hypothetical protein